MNELCSGEEDGLLARLAVEPGFMKAARWILQPQSEQRFLLKCFVDEEGEFVCTLHFSVVGDPEVFRLETKATCSVPRLLNFPEGLFERSVQERPADCGLKKTYITDEVNMRLDLLKEILRSRLHLNFSQPSHCYKCLWQDRTSRTMVLEIW